MLFERVGEVDHHLVVVLVNDVCILFLVVGVQPPSSCLINPIAIGETPATGATHRDCDEPNSVFQHRGRLCHRGSR